VLGEDDDGTCAMRLLYDGGTNHLQKWGRNPTSGDMGPWPEVARDSGRLKAEQWNPDPPCFNETQRFVDCGNGTVTGLVDLRDANCFGPEDWPTAQDEVANLADGVCDFSDGSRKGDWRLRNRAEWIKLVDGSCSGVRKLEGKDFCCSEPGRARKLGVQISDYWTSSTYDAGPHCDFAHFVSLDDGADHDVEPKTDTGYVWPVRSGNSR
jgi:hypothetical protein